MDTKRCPWSTLSQVEQDYHDTQWCKESHDDDYMFEMLILEGMQAGLSWVTVLNKRETMREAFLNFDYQALAKRDEEDIAEWMENPGLIRNRLKLKSVVRNARGFIEIQKEFGSFDAYIWKFTDGKIIDLKTDLVSEIPASTALSDEISKDLKKRGFNFVGTVIIYSFLQSIGVVNDHIESCAFKH